MKIPDYVRDEVLLLLVRAAQRGRKVEYGPIMRACGIPRGQAEHNGKAIGDIVGEISEWTFKHWHVYLSAIVVHKVTGYPGGGFFGLTEIPNKFRRASARWTEKLLTADEKAFIDGCQQQVFEWASRSDVSLAITVPKGKKVAATG